MANEADDVMRLIRRGLEGGVGGNPADINREPVDQGMLIRRAHPNTTTSVSEKPVPRWKLVA